MEQSRALWPLSEVRAETGGEKGPQRITRQAPEKKAVKVVYVYPRQNELGGSGNAVASRGERPRQGEYSEHRRCYNCQRIGHIGRDCPLKKNPNLGVKCELIESAETPLVGRTVSVKARLLNMSVPAILDTGSMVSIMPVGVLARAQKTGFDVDSLEVIPKGSMVPVLDASGNSMTFLGAVFDCSHKLEGGDRAEVAFHISDVKEGEILLGTNALKEVGVQVVLTRRGSEVRNKDLERVPNDGIPRYMMDKSKRGYKTQLLQAVAEVHNKEKEFNVGKRGKVKHEYDCRHKMGQRKPQKRKILFIGCHLNGEQGILARD
ncbi:zinc knuckle [Ostertagia ostertagi]